MLLRRRIMMAASGRIDYSETPLTFEMLAPGDITLQASSARAVRAFRYSINGGAAISVNSATYPGVSIHANEGDIVQFWGRNTQDGSANNFNKLYSPTSHNVYGNPFSLVYDEDFIGQTEVKNSYQFVQLFSGSTGLVSASGLCLIGMGSSIYKSMFLGCRALTEPPALNAQELNGACYGQMFQNCAALRTAPKLPAKHVSYGAYENMFYGCSMLNEVECLAETFEASTSTSGWLQGVANSGTFKKKAGVAWSSGTSGIPTGWNVIEL